MFPEYDQICEAIAEMRERNKGFDLQMARKLVSVLRKHNQRMQAALIAKYDDRSCELAIAETLDALDKLP